MPNLSYFAPFVLLLFLSTSPSIGQAKPTQTAVDSQKVTRLYRQALSHISNRDPRNAAATFRQVIAIDSTHYESWLGLGEVYMRVGRIDEARTYLQRAHQLAPDRIEARFQLAQTYMKADNALFSAVPTKSSNKQTARQLFEEIIADHPNHIPSRMMLGELWMMVPPPDAQRALNQYESILKFKPGDPSATAGAAASRLRLGQLQIAADEISRLLEKNPRDTHISLLLGTAYYRMEEYQKAIDSYQLSIDALTQPPPQAPPQLIQQWTRRRHVRQWNLRLAYLALHGEYPGDLKAQYQIHLAPVTEESPVRFTDVGPLFGVDKYDRGRGSAWGDYDHDGDLDLFTTGIHTDHALYRNEDGAGFTDIAAAVGLDADHLGGWGASCADFDNDGWLDIYITRDAWEGGTPNALFKNRGDGSFAEVARLAGVDDPDASFTHTWGDYDGDGFLDLYVADGVTGDGSPNKLFHNQGDGSFVDVASVAGVANRGKTLGVAFGDYDDDGDLDLYASDVGGPNTLYRNEGDGTFSDVTSAAGVSEPNAGSYVTFFFDYNDDGHLDFFVGAFAYYASFVESQVTGQAAGPSAPHLYRNNGDGTFTDVAAGKCLSRAVGSMGAGFGDIDYDGLIDIYLSNGGPNFPRLEPNLLYRNKGDDDFVDITTSAGVGHLGKGHGVSFADYDRDGDLDLYAGVGGHYPGDLWHNSLYRNEGHGNHWLVVEVQGTTSNWNGIGTRLRVESGDFVQEAEISSGNGFGCTNSFPMEFGLGQRTRVDLLEIRWPTGQTEIHRDLAADQVLRFEEGQ